MSTLPAPVVQQQNTATGVYGREFWMAYVANLAVVTGNALTFRFAELVNLLGGTDADTGWILGAATAVSLGARVWLGQGIDRHGVRIVWTVTSMLYVGGLLLVLFSPSVGGQMLAGQVLYRVALAGIFSCSLVHIQNLVPVERRTEIIGVLGSSGFLGMILGSQLADMLYRFGPPGWGRLALIFAAAACAGALYLVLVTLLTRRDVHRRPRHTPPMWPLLCRYGSRPVLIVAPLMGMGFAVMTTFLTRYATSLHLAGVGTFFSAYALTAFFVRMWSRGWNRSIGRHGMILMGLTGHAIGLAALVFVHAEWQFVFPAVFAGFGHALLFPAVISLVSGEFPRPFRGTGNTIALGFIDVGGVVSSPIIGMVIDVYGFVPMLAGTSAVMTAGVAYYAWATHGKIDPELSRAPRESKVATTAVRPAAGVVPRVEESPVTAR